MLDDVMFEQNIISLLVERMEHFLADRKLFLTPTQSFNYNVDWCRYSSFLYIYMFKKDL